MPISKHYANPFLKSQGDARRIAEREKKMPRENVYSEDVPITLLGSTLYYPAEQPMVGVRFSDCSAVVAQSKHQTAATVCRLGFRGGYGDLTSHEKRSISLDGESGEKESRRFGGGGLFRLTSCGF
ncbi:hypothetical protein Hanom_Chr12g01083381 [Helianthus anomalus]